MLSSESTQVGPLRVQSRAFLDESGGLNTGHFVLGGYVGAIEMWERFSIDWQAVLDQDPPWPPFHAVECERGEGGFEVLDRHDRQRRIGQLIAVIAKHRPHAVLSVVDIAHWHRGVPRPSGSKVERRRAMWKYPYVFSATHLFGKLADLHETVHEELGRIDVVFDFMQQFRVPLRTKIERDVLQALSEDHPEHAARLAPPRWPKPEERAQHVPLQAADLLVWHYRRYKDEPDGKHRRAFRDLKRASPFRFAGGYRLQERWVQGHSFRDVQYP